MPGRVRFSFDGASVEAQEGTPVAVALLSAGILAIRRAPVTGAPRGALCLMGLCQECLVEADGGHVESCRLPVRAGLDVRSLDSAS